MWGCVNVEAVQDRAGDGGGVICLLCVTWDIEGQCEHD